MTRETRCVVWLGGLVWGWMVLAAGLTAAQAGGGPENVALVVNADSWASLTIANEYIHLRRIPSMNVVYLKGLDAFQTTDVDTFRKKILLPVMKTLYERGLLSHIDCIAYSADLPTAINVSSDFTGVTLEKYQTKVGSINGLTYLYQLVLDERQEFRRLYLSLNVNYYMRRPTKSVGSVPQSAEDRAAAVKVSQLMAAKKYAEALKVLQPLAARRKSDASVQYNLACCLALLEREDEAIDALLAAVNAGWADRKHAEADPDLAGLKNSPNFKALLGKMDENRQKPFEVQPTLGFRSQYQWNAGGEKVPDQGLRYMLSTVLGVTSGRGNSVNEVLSALRRSVAADGTQPRGTVYFMENSDVRSTTRMPAFLSAAQALEGTEVTPRILAGVLPERKDDVAGAVIGKASFSWSKSGSTILPGAICENLTSFGGALLEKNSQTPLTEFIRYGAAGSSGTVTEPYSIQNKFPFPFIHVHYARGCSLAEAFYQSVFGPYQLLIVGDPLCQPWAAPISFAVPQPQPNQTVSGDLMIKPVIAGGPASEARLDHYELYIDGRHGAFGPAVRSMMIKEDQWSDGWHELSVVAIAKGPIETKSRVLIPVVVDNGNGMISLELIGNSQGEVTYGDTVELKVKSPVPGKMEVAGNGRFLGTIEGAEGSLRVDSRELGMGPIRLQAAMLIEGKPSFSPPVDLLVNPPAPLMKLPAVSAAALKPGLALTIGSEEPIIIEAAGDAKWLPEQKPKAGESLSLDAYFSVPIDDLYQFQVQGNAAGELLVDGKSLWRADDPETGTTKWTMIPVQLAQGWHQFQLTGKVAAKPALQIRFGNQGCKSLDSARFKHKP